MVVTVVLTTILRQSNGEAVGDIRSGTNAYDGRARILDEEE